MSDSLTTETAATQAAPDYVNEREEGRKALKELLKPVQGSLMIGRILAGLSGVLAIAPISHWSSWVACSPRPTPPGNPSTPTGPC